MISSWKVNSKQAATEKAKCLEKFLIECEINPKLTVAGRRPSREECKKMSIPVGTYLAELLVGESAMLSAHHHKWRLAYKLLERAIETKLLEYTGEITG